MVKTTFIVKLEMVCCCFTNINGKNPKQNWMINRGTTILGNLRVDLSLSKNRGPQIHMRIIISPIK
jgi:hypothetical protein